MSLLEEFIILCSLYNFVFEETYKYFAIVKIWWSSGYISMVLIDKLYLSIITLSVLILAGIKFGGFGGFW